MIQIIKVEKTGDIKLDKISNVSELYKKCGFRKNDGFENIYTWNINNITIELWGRNIEKSNLKNNYVFPQPFNKTVYGTCALIGKNNMDLVNIDDEIWKSLFTLKPDVIMTHVQTPDEESDAAIELNKFSSLSVAENKNKIKNKKDNGDYNDDDDSDISLSDSEDSQDSELKEEPYLYSSEEEGENKAK